MGARKVFDTDSVVAAYRFSCSMACGILVPQPGITPMPFVLEGGFLTTLPPGKSPRPTLLMIIF